MVVKNVSGYDMSKLYVGSLRDARRARARQLQDAAAAAPCSAARSRRCRNARAHARSRTSARCPSSRPPPSRCTGSTARSTARTDSRAGCILLFEGSEASIERAIRDLRSALGAAGVPETRRVDRNAADLAAARRRRLRRAARRSGRSPIVTSASRATPTRAPPRSLTIARRHARSARRSATCCTGDVRRCASPPRTAAPPSTLMPFADALRDALPAARLMSAQADLQGEIDAVGHPARGDRAHAHRQSSSSIRAATLGPGRFVGGI